MDVEDHIAFSCVRTNIECPLSCYSNIPSIKLYNNDQSYSKFHHFRLIGEFKVLYLYS